ncbi:SDR family NAD(P)-dependent oxidoreductase [Lentzea sp. E54]|uniref:SDR family NAD(P)-dependent oxidoreductase n=1 Tax=Lentzea xerophila TaxID=3435883 RepID=UPI003DA5457B
MATALVTDPSEGIGSAFARVLGARGHDLVLAGDDERELGRLAGELADRHDITVEVMVVNLAEARGRSLVEDRLRDEDRMPVDLLVNTAAGGPATSAWSTPAHRLQAQFERNATTVLRLTTAALDGMVRRRRGAVINVSGTDGQAPWRARCTVQDAFVRSLSEDLAAALRGTQVHVMALCLGRRRCQVAGAAVDDVVRRALRDVANRRVVSGRGSGLLAGLLPERWVNSSAARWLVRR